MSSREAELSLMREELRGCVTKTHTASAGVKQMIAKHTPNIPPNVVQVMYSYIRMVEFFADLTDSYVNAEAATRSGLPGVLNAKGGGS